MSERDLEYVSEEEAARLWQRAAQLQAEAAKSRERVLHDTDPETADADVDPGYAVAHVRAAAVEAGISEEFLDAALMDLHAERSLPTSKHRGGPGLHRVLGNPDKSVVVRRVATATAEEVFEAMEEVLPADPYRLNLVDRRGDPLNGGLLVFDITGSPVTSTDSFAYQMAWADIKKLIFSLRSISETETEITVRAPVPWAQNINVVANLLMTGTGGGIGLFFGSVLASAILPVTAAPMLAAVAAAMAAGGAGAGGLSGWLGYGAMMRYGVRRGERAISGLLGAVTVRAQRGFGITWRPHRSERVGAGAEPTALPPGSEVGSE